MKIATIYKNRKESQLIQSICFLACSRRSDSGVQCKVREREKNSRNLRLEVIGWNSGYANTRFHTKLNVRNSLLFHLACFLHSFFISLKANMIKTTAFMTFLDESINILNHRVPKIGQKSCTHNKNFEPKGPERDTWIIAWSRWRPCYMLPCYVWWRSISCSQIWYEPHALFDPWYHALGRA